MIEYRIMETNYVTSCVFKTNNLSELKDKVMEVLKDNYLNERYARAGIRKPNPTIYEGAWIEVYVDGIKVESLDYYDAYKLKEV